MCWEDLLCQMEGDDPYGVDICWLVVVGIGIGHLWSPVARSAHLCQALYVLHITDHSTQAKVTNLDNEVLDGYSLPTGNEMAP